MSDEHFILPQPSRPWYQRISVDRSFSIAAIVASLAAAGFTGWYACDTHGMRRDAQEAARKQAEDVRRAREAAERSANAAAKLADAMKDSADAARQSAGLARQAVGIFRELTSIQEKQFTASERMFQLDQRPQISFEILLRFWEGQQRRQTLPGDRVHQAGYQARPMSHSSCSC
jgi:nitrogen regulatory protein PII-like uncharacterized protein